MSKLIILDRDGVINEDSDHYIRSAEDWHPIPGSIEAIAQLSKANYQIAVATNQSGLARGYFQHEDLEAMHQKLTQLVEQQGGKLAGIYFCPHGPDDHCDCRKPKPGMIIQILKDLQQPAETTWVVGDSLRDLQAGLQAGCKTALVKTGKGQRTLDTGALKPSEPDSSHELNNSPVFSNLKAFTAALLKEGSE